MIIELLALGWFTNLFVKLWIDRLKNYPHIRSLKPFSCQMCLGFWFGCLYYYSLGIGNMFIFACLTSLSAVTTNGIVNYLNKP